MKTYLSVLGITTLILLSSNASAAVRYVDLNCTNPVPPYADWSTAATNIQDAIDSSSIGDLVLVTNGVYQTGGQVVYGSLTNRVVINKAITVQSENGPTFTTICGYPVTGTSAVRCVYLTNNAVLIGFTLTNGATLDSSAMDPAHDCSGGGAWCEFTNSILTNCLLVANSAQNQGSAVNGGTLNNCVLASNIGNVVYSSSLAGCILSNNINPTAVFAPVTWLSSLERCSVINNAGGVFFCTLNNCILSGNGAGSYNSSINNCLLTANNGYASMLDTLVNCTVVGNANGLFGSTAYNCIVYYNNTDGGANFVFNEEFPGSMSYCCTTPDPGGTGNIISQPQLTDSAHISATSPCRGAGSTAYVSGVDIDGEAWLNPPSIGCDEYYAGETTGSLRVSIEADSTNVEAEFTLVHFMGTIIGHATYFVLDFGDGTTISNQLAIAHWWARAGDYSVMLTAYNDSNPNGVNANVTIHVLPRPVHFVGLNSPNPTAPYSAWATAATNIQDAVDESVDGDLILVTNGVYQSGGQVVYGSLTNRVAITKAVIVQSVNGPAVTVIQGYPASETTNGDSAVRCVYLTNNATLVGFTLTNGATRAAGDSFTEQCGGGVFGESISSAVYNCVIAGNSANNSGGGVMQVELNNCVLTANSSENAGGGAADSTLDNCVLAGNSTVQTGGGASGSVLSNCTVTGNSAGNGGGVDNASVLNNCILYYNSAPNNPNWVAPFWGPGTTLNYCCTTPDPGSTGNITGEPLFIDLAGGDLHLQSNSPCINTGQNGYVTSASDLDGNPRIVGNSVDMGAYEFQTVVPLQVQIQADSTNLVAGSSLEFAGSYLGGIPYGFVWDFGDGTSISNQISVSHSWVAVGDYIVTLTAFDNSDPDGVSATVTVHVVSNAVHYVSLTSTNPITPYSSWATAATDIQDAVDAAYVGGTVLVSNGVYQAGMCVLYNTMSNRVAVTKSLTLQSVNGPTVTAIDGGEAIRCLYLSSNILVSGFTLQNGNQANGAGVYCQSPNDVLNGCVIIGNSSPADWSSGGGAYGGVLNHCLLVGNSASYQGGAAAFAILNYCMMSKNTQPAYGGAAYASLLNNCIISSNAAAWGGGVANCEVNNSLLIGNLADNGGGGAVWSQLNDCTIISNTVPPEPGTDGGAGVYGGTLDNCIVYYNNGDNYTAYFGSISLDHCCTTPDPGGTANINNAPQFMDLAGGDFHLQTNSPCINSGNNAFVTSTNDLDGNPRIAGGTVDMGAYEYQTPVSKISYAWLQQYGLPISTNVDTTDLDGTGFNIYQDWIAGLNPTNSLSVLAMLPPAPTNSPAGIVVAWQSVSNRTYFLQSSTNLGTQPAFLTIQTGIAGQDGTTSYLDTTATNGGPYFYRVGVQP